MNKKEQDACSAIHELLFSRKLQKNKSVRKIAAALRLPRNQLGLLITYFSFATPPSDLLKN